MNTLFTLTFWKDCAERAIKSAAQAVGLVLVGGSSVVNVLTLDWTVVGGAALTGGLLSLVTSIGSAGFANKGTASLTDAVTAA